MPRPSLGIFQFPAETLGQIEKFNITLLVSPQNHVVSICKEQRKANGQFYGPTDGVEILPYPQALANG